MKEIILKQNAVIQHDLLNVGKMVDERLKELNIENLVATDDTIKAMKSLRADLNAEFKDFEEQRKTIKNLVAKPYMTLEEVYKEQVSEKYNGAISTLKSKIDEHEIKIKLEKKEVVESYFDECVDFSGFDFVKFENVGININLSTSIKKYREEVDAFFAKINDDLNLIETQEEKAEILVDYKKDLNVARAINDVKERIASEMIEKERQQQQEQARRERELDYIDFQFSEFEKVYVHCEHKDLSISLDDVETRSSIEFNAIIKDFENQIKAKHEIVRKPVQIAPPEVKAEPKILMAKFSVKGTLEQLTTLKQYLIDNNLEYNNL